MDIQEFIRKFNSRDAHPFFQFVKYGIAVVVATVAQLAIFYLLAGWLIPALTAEDKFVVGMAKLGVALPVQEMTDAVRSNRAAINNLIAFMFSNFVAYLLNIVWVFRRGRHAFWLEVGLFYAVSAVSFLAGTAVAWLLMRFAGMQTTYAILINIVVSVIINYIFRKFLVFKG